MKLHVEYPKWLKRFVLRMVVNDPELFAVAGILRGPDASSCEVHKGTFTGRVRYLCGMVKSDSNTAVISSTPLVSTQVPAVCVRLSREYAGEWVAIDNALGAYVGGGRTLLHYRCHVETAISAMVQLDLMSSSEAYDLLHVLSESARISVSAVDKGADSDKAYGSSMP